MKGKMRVWGGVVNGIWYWTISPVGAGGHKLHHEITDDAACNYASKKAARRAMLRVAKLYGLEEST